MCVHVWFRHFPLMWFAVFDLVCDLNFLCFPRIWGNNNISSEWALQYCSLQRSISDMHKMQDLKRIQEHTNHYLNNHCCKLQIIGNFKWNENDVNRFTNKK